jgi:hypothetical protein
MIFNSKEKLEIYSNNIPIEFLKNFFKIFPNNLPNYFKNIPKQCPFSKFRNDKTIKTCSGIVNFYKRSLVFLSPFDIEYVIENETVHVKIPDLNLGEIKFHNNNQFLDYINKNIYLCISKLCFNIFLKSNVPLIITNPAWQFNDFEILPGILNATNPMELNLFLPVKKNIKNIFIKQNTPLCMIHTETNKKIEIIFNKNKYNPITNNGLNYIFSNFKYKLLKNKYFL